MNQSGWNLIRFDAASVGLATTWRELVGRSGGSLVQWPEFVFSCVDTLAKGPVRLAVHRRGDDVTAAAILGAGHVLPEVFVEDQMPLGAWLQMPSEDIVLLARALLRRVPFAVRVGISQIDSRFVSRPSHSPGVGTLDYIETPWVEIAGSYEAYWAGRGKNLRTNMRKQREKLVRDGVATRMEVVTDPARMHDVVGDYAGLESKGWKAGGGTAVSEAHAQIQFYRVMLERFAQLGMARVYRYFFGERLVASELCLCGNGEFLILKTTYDESTAPFSPASLLRQEMFESLFGDGQTRRVEFYGPLKDWHTRWTDLHRSIYHANVFSNAPVGRLARILQSRRKGAEVT